MRGPIALLVVFCALILLLLVDLSRMRKDSNDRSRNNWLTDYKGSQNESIRRDCDLETVYAMDDSQCRNICKDHGAYRVKNGVCLNVLVFETSDVQNKCAPKQGLLAYLVGDPVFGRTKAVCLSVDLGIQPDRSDRNNIICRGGDINIDYVKSFPQLSECKCTKDDILTLVESVKTVRTHGVCADKRLKPVMESNSLLYTKTI